MGEGDCPRSPPRDHRPRLPRPLLHRPRPDPARSAPAERLHARPATALGTAGDRLAHPAPRDPHRRGEAEPQSRARPLPGVGIRSRADQLVRGNAHHRSAPRPGRRSSRPDQDARTAVVRPRPLPTPPETRPPRVTPSADPEVLRVTGDEAAGDGGRCGPPVLRGPVAHRTHRRRDLRRQPRPAMRRASPASARVRRGSRSGLGRDGCEGVRPVSPRRSGGRAGAGRWCRRPPGGSTWAP